MGHVEESEKMKALRSRTGMTQKDFSDYFNIPYKTYQKWELGSREYPAYIYELMEYKALKEGICRPSGNLPDNRGKET